MIVMKKNIFAKACFVGLFVMFCFFISGCRGYSYASYKRNAESALQKKQLKKALNLYSVIFKNENDKTSPLNERAAWAFYRLGVIAEISGKTRLAIGYYWGDKIDEGYYDNFPLIRHFAQSGWERLDKGEQPRTVEQILEFEDLGLPRPGKPEKVIKENRPAVTQAPDRQAQPGYSPKTAVDDRPRRTFNRSLTPHPPGVPQPFRVLH